MRYGEDVQLESAESGAVAHNALNVYGEMLLQICSDYPGLPDPRTMTVPEIVFFYNGLRPALRKHTRAKES